MIILRGLGADNTSAPQSSPGALSTRTAGGAPAPTSVTSKVPYACTLTYCYGLTAAWASELQLVQTEANNLAALIGSPARVSTDGKIDAATVKLISQLFAARQVGLRVKPTQSNIAANPQAFSGALRDARPSAMADVKIVVVDPAPTPTTSAPPATPAVVIEPATFPGAGAQVTVSPAPPAPSSKWKLWAAVGAGVAALAAGVVAAKHGG